MDQQQRNANVGVMVLVLAGMVAVARFGDAVLAAGLIFAAGFAANQLLTAVQGAAANKRRQAQRQQQQAGKQQQQGQHGQQGQQQGGKQQQQGQRDHQQAH